MPRPARMQTTAGQETTTHPAATASHAAKAGPAATANPAATGAIGVPHLRRPALGVVMVLSAGVLFSFNGTVSKLLLLGGFDAPRLTALRATGATLCLVAIRAAIRPGLRGLAVRWAELPALIGFGVTGFFLVPMLYFVAIRRLPVGIGLLFEYTGPLLVALWVRFGQRQPVKSRLWAGLAACLIGLASVAEIWTGTLNLDPIGVAAGLACAVGLAFYYVLGSRSTTDRDPLTVTCWAMAVSAMCGAVVSPWWSFPTELLGRTSHGVPIWLLTCYLIVGGTVVSYLLVTMSMRHLPPTSVGILGMIEPPLAGAFAWLLLGEALSAPQLAGGLIVLAGVVLAETARTGPTGPTGARTGPTGPTPEIPPT